jgi:putrescine transport system substrate-binding protein
VSAAFRSALALATGLLAAACGGGPGDPPVAEAAPEERVLNVYNWFNYIGKDTLAEFESRSGIKVNYDIYDSNQLLETKLLTGRSGYDVVFPSMTNLGRMASAGVFRRLEKDKLPNLRNMDPEIMRMLAINDSGNEHGISYLWGTTGIGYNPLMVRRALGDATIDSWQSIFDPAVASKLAACGLTILDSPDDVFEAAEIYLGTDPANEDLEELAAAERLLLGIRPYVRAFDSTLHAASLANAEQCIALSWSGFMLQARANAAVAAKPVQLTYVIPKEGAPAYFEAAAIPVDAPHPANAHAFLDFLMEPAVIAAISNELRYANGNRASIPHLSPPVRDDPAIYPDKESMSRLHPSRMRSQSYSREVNRAWTRVKSGQ